MSHVRGSVHIVVIRGSSATRATGAVADPNGCLTMNANLHTFLNLNPGTATVRIG